MGKKKGKTNNSSESQPSSSQPQAPTQQQGRSQPQAPTQQQARSQPQAPTQQQGRSQPQVPTQQQGRSQPQAPTQQQGRSQPQAPTQQQGRSQPQAPTQQQGRFQPLAPSQPQPSQQQSGQRKPRPKTEDKPKQDNAKASSSSQQQQSGPWVAQYAFGESAQQTSSQPQQSAWPLKNPSNQPQSAAPAPAWGLKTQVQQAMDQNVQQPMRQEQPPPGAWTPQYAFGETASQKPMDRPPQPRDRPQSQQGPSRPTQQQTRGVPPRSDENIENLSKSVSNVSLASSVSSQSSKHSTGPPSTAAAAAPISTSALIPLTPNKGSGTLGRRVTVDVNFLPLLIEKLLPTVYQYDVTIEPNLPKRMLPHIFETYRQNNFKNISVAFDGQKIAVAPRILPIDNSIQQQTKVIDENGRERVYMVSMKEARDSKIDFQSLKNYKSVRQYDSPLRAMQMLEIVLKSPFLNKIGVQSGRSFYMRPDKRLDLGDNYELWTGLYQATVLGTRPYLNVDIAHKAFPSEMSVIDVIPRNVDISRELQSRDQSALQLHLNGLLIKYALPGNDASGRTYKFFGLNPNSKKFKFKSDQDKKEYTIEEYFRSRKVSIKFPLLPTLKLGNAVKNITVPMEFCSIAGNQAVNKKCTEMQTRNMIKEAATSTDVRRGKIEEMLRRIAHNQSSTLSQFGIQVGGSFTNVPARILPAPTLEYKNNKTTVPSKGQWRIDNLQFLAPVSLTTFGVLIMDKYVRDDAVRQFCDCISRFGRSLDMQIPTQYSIYKLDPFSRSIRDDLYQEMSKMISKNTELLFCIIPDRGDTYGKVKQCAELDCGILTQCVKANTLTRKGSDQSTVTNILMKVNAKLNGTNHKLAKVSLSPLMSKPFMLIGGDVTHPSPGQSDIPSVVGVVSSHDVHGFQYNKSWRLQDPKQEMISDFDKILYEHLDYFEKQRKRLPDAILYFRDGVSEGQFQQVLTIELNAMYRGCQQYRQGYKPKITFIVVQKRHHTRFFPPPNSGLGRDDRKNNNVPPGTIVDNEITHPNETQFYLVSHQSIQGVARPTKYCLLRDDSNFPIDELQTITYNLCHFFARCTRTVSYPAPTYYAHLAAARGRVYIEGKNINMTRLDREFQSRTVKPEIIKNHPMYFI